MRIVHVSYANIRHCSDPAIWLDKINFFVALTEEMAKRADVSSVHCINYEGTLTRNRVTYHFLKCDRMQIAFPGKIHAYVKKLNPDVIIVHGYNFPWQVLLLRRSIGKHVKIVTQHHFEKPLRHYKKILQYRVDQLVSANFFVSFDQARPWIKEKQIRRAETVHEAMECPSVFYPIERGRAWAATRVQEDQAYLWVGRLARIKDPMTLIRAFLLFADENRRAKLYLIHHSNELLGDVHQLLQQHPLKDQIVIVGKVEHKEMLYWYNSVDFIISTSHDEGSGVAVCEAMSCGCIPILTDIPSFKKMSDNGKCGFLFAVGDVQDLALALSKTNTLNIDKARKHVLDQYVNNLSASAISTKMISVFETLLNVSPRP